ncbi:MAG: hypothetical protein IT204_25405 [Fimbriimonadaceae bacterium]|nr:hypothetical protein [Fimbriimonadaceae bacterium]
MRCWLVVLLGAVGAAYGWSPAVVERDGVRLEIAEQPAWTALDAPRAVPVTITNRRAVAVSGTVTAAVIDTWTVDAPATRPVSVAAGQSVRVEFPIRMGAGTYKVFYPIHASAKFGAEEWHTVLVVAAEPPPAVGATSDLGADPAGAKLPLTVVAGSGALALARLRPGRVVVLPQQGAAYALPAGTTTDPRSRANYAFGTSSTRGATRDAVQLHPPYQGGTGAVAGDYRLQLPDAAPIRLDTGLAIRDSSPAEGASDGVTFRVLVSAGGAFREVAQQHSAAKVWEPWSVDLSSYRGQTVTLRLLGDPGPAHNTSCDSAFWGAPLLRVGAPLPVEAADAKAARAQLAATAAQAVSRGQSVAAPAVGWRLQSPLGDLGAAVVPGPAGLLDAQIAFAGQPGGVVYDGFTAEVAGAGLLQQLTSGAVTAERVGEALQVTHRIGYQGRSVPAVATVRPAAGALQIAWAMPGVQRDQRGQPRYTKLHLGPASVATQQVYFGHGHVLEGCPKFSLGYGGFSVTTRYVGADYANGLALVSASDPVPDRFEHDQASHLTTLVAHHDATFTYVPSATGAFAAARQWRAVANLPMSPGVPAIRGKMCVDQWGGDYRQAANDLALASAYGIDEAVFVKHVWQRWGYDYRLPDIWPPAGNRADFDAMAAAAKLNGRLFVLHDNYIDYYPDATGFSYDHIGFNEDGTPRLAWLNEGRNARSYKWLPTALQPFLESNLRTLEREVGLDGIFIDVWSAAPPVDQYDRAGNFLPKMVDTAASAKGFDTARQILGGPTLSEAGHDGLIGHLDAAQADHLTVQREGARHELKLDFTQWDRVPWFDMGHHGKFVLLAGGLGPRYSGERPTALHGYGSDDYLSLTVLGGRTPMCDGPFYRRTVSTYYLLQPLCAELERQELLAHAFDGAAVTRQRVTWSNGAVTVNRGPTDWTVDGTVLPEYGFVARAGALRADISRRDGVISASSQAPGLLFVDARPPYDFRSNRLGIAPRVTGCRDLGGGRFELTMAWTVTSPAPASARAFFHVCGPGELLPGWVKNSDILFQLGHNVTADKLTTVGTHQVLLTGTLPDGLKPGTLTLKYGVYDPERGGQRYELDAPVVDEGRFDGGTLTVTGGGPAAKVAHIPTTKVLEPGRYNTAGRVLGFGAVRTNGAFRLDTRQNPWRLTLLPGSRPAEVALQLDRLGAAGGRLTKIEQVDPAGRVVATVAPPAAGPAVRFGTAAQAFGYRLTVVR